jgi:hypothetical protein
MPVMAPRGTLVYKLGMDIHGDWFGNSFTSMEAALAEAAGLLTDIWNLRTATPDTSRTYPWWPHPVDEAVRFLTGDDRPRWSPEFLADHATWMADTAQTNPALVVTTWHAIDFNPNYPDMVFAADWKNIETVVLPHYGEVPVDTVTLPAQVPGQPYLDATVRGQYNPWAFIIHKAPLD